MKKKLNVMRWLLPVAAVSLLAWSCTREIPGQAGDDNGAGNDKGTGNDVIATFADAGTRTSLGEDGSVLWSAGDEISVWLKTADNREYKLDGEGGTTSGTFKYVSGATDGAAVKYNYGVYPYNAENTVTSDGYVQVRIPDKQEYAEGGFANGMNVAVAASEDRNLTFKNVCGYIKIPVYGEGVKVKAVSLLGQNEEHLSGLISLEVTPDGDPAFHAEVEEGLKEVYIKMDEPLEIGATADEATDLWLMAIPQKLSTGFEISILAEDAEGNEFHVNQRSSEELEIQRSRVSEFPALELKAEGAAPEPEDEIAGHEYVEMGVTTEDGTVLKWATMNVGATKPEESGDYFAWGETEPKENYSWDTYKHVIEGGTTWRDINKYTIDDGQTDGYWYMIKVNIESGESKDVFWGDKKTQLEAADDAATSNWGSSWRMPTDAEWTALRDEANFKWDWTDDYEATGIAGMIVTSKVSGYEGNTIFLPAAGYRYGTSLFNAGSDGDYWSSSLSENYSDCAKYVLFLSEEVYRNGNSRFLGSSVRPVSE